LTPAFSYGITKYGVATPVHSFEDLTIFINDRNHVLQQKSLALPRFRLEMLYAFDGRATERITAQLLS
jgi:hypothetical protein